MLQIPRNRRGLPPGTTPAPPARGAEANAGRIAGLGKAGNPDTQDGVSLVNQAGASLNEIVDAIKNVANAVADIATASAEQAQGLEQVNKVLVQMDDLTQQNSKLVEESASTARILAEQSQVVDEHVNFFQLARTNAGEAEARPAPAVRPVQMPIRAQAA